jgi:hypothetical protein
MLTNLVKKRLDVPKEDGQWIEIRKLPWRKLREASETQQHAAFAFVKTLGKDGMAAVKEVTAEQIAAFKANPAASYDPGVLMRSAVTAWSYSDKPTPEQIDDLDPDTASWLVDEIVALSRPPRDEEAAKNG